MRMTKTKKVENKHKNKTKAFEEGIMEWTSFYKNNVHRFIVEYLDLPLHWFQMIIVYMFSLCDFNMLIASRGIGKSYITAVFSCAMCILKPNSKYVLCSSTKG